MKKRISIENTLYIYDEGPFCFPIGSALMKQVLESNRFSDDEITTCLRRYEDLIHAPLLSGKYNFPKRMILNADTFYELANADEYQFPSNLFSNKPITIKRKFFLPFLKEILHYFERPREERDIEIALTEEGHVKSNSGLMAIVKEGLFVFIFPYFLSSGNREPLIFSNIGVISDAWTYYDRLWHALPDECKHENMIKAQLIDIIGTLTQEKNV
jgi:hypothetical protein